MARSQQEHRHGQQWQLFLFISCFTFSACLFIVLIDGRVSWRKADALITLDVNGDENASRVSRLHMAGFDKIVLETPTKAERAQRIKESRRLAAMIDGSSFKEFSLLETEQFVVQPDRPLSDCHVEPRQLLHYFYRPDTIGDHVCPGARAFSSRVNDQIEVDCKGAASWSTEPDETPQPLKPRDSIDTTAAERIYVQCRFPLLGKEVTDVNLHVQPVVRKSVMKKADATTFNVVVIMLDGFSRELQQTWFPRVNALFERDLSHRMAVFDFQHFSVVGGASLPNQLALWCGAIGGDGEAQCKTQKRDVWTRFAQAGFVTAMVAEADHEDLDHSEFEQHHRLFGSKLRSETDDEESGCSYGQPLQSRSLSYISSFLQMYRHRGTFAVYVPTAGASLNFLPAKTLDDELSKFFLDLAELQRSPLDNTVFFMLADHGPNIDSYNRFIAGEMEHRNPFLRVVVPRKLESELPLEMLRRNTERLVTPLDVYASLDELARKATAVESLPSVSSDGTDLFSKEVPAERTCHHAHIPGEWCNCWGIDSSK